ECRLGGFVVPVDGRVQTKRGSFDRACAFDDAAIEIADQQRAGGKLRPKESFWIYQEQVFVAGQKETEMVADSLLISHTGGPTQNGSQIDSRLAIFLAHRCSLHPLCFQHCDISCRARRKRSTSSAVL